MNAQACGSYTTTIRHSTLSDFPTRFYGFNERVGGLRYGGNPGVGQRTTGTNRHKELRPRQHTRLRAVANREDNPTTKDLKSTRVEQGTQPLRATTSAWWQTQGKQLQGQSKRPQRTRLRQLLPVWLRCHPWQTQTKYPRKVYTYATREQTELSLGNCSRPAASVEPRGPWT